MLIEIYDQYSGAEMLINPEFISSLKKDEWGQYEVTMANRDKFFVNGEELMSVLSAQEAGLKMILRVPRYES